MNIKKNISLKPFNTFGIDVNAKEFVSVDSMERLNGCVRVTNPAHLMVLGGGSNMLLTKDVEALVLHINLKGISILSKSENRVKSTGFRRGKLA